MSNARLVKFAALVNAGKPPTVAAREAGYSDSYARSSAATAIRAQAEAAGLLAVTEADTRDAAERAGALMTEAVEDVTRVLIREAKAGEAWAVKEYLNRLLGQAKASVDVTNDGEWTIIVKDEEPPEGEGE